MSTSTRPRVRRAAAMLAAVGLAAGIVGCAPSRAETSANGDLTVYGDTKAVGLGQMNSYVTVDQNGDPVELGLRFTEAALNGLPTTPKSPHILLPLPKEAKGTIFDHAMVNWYGQGRKPAELFGQPQFAFHFYTIPHDEVMAIDAAAHPEKASNLLAPRYVAADYMPEPGDVLEKTVPKMGLHWLDSTREFGPGKPEFDRVFVNGSYDGKLIFQEPVATREWLLAKKDHSAEIKQPAAYQLDGYQPTVYSFSFDDATGEYVVALEDMVERTSS